MVAITEISSPGFGPEQVLEEPKVDDFSKFVDQHPAIRLGFENFNGSTHPSMDGVYLENFALLPEFGLPEIVGYEESKIDYEVNPNLNIGAANSHHGVTFGELQLSVGGSNTALNVAVKPFDGEYGRQDAMNEFRCLVTAKALGFETYSPFGLAIDNHTTYLLTHYRKGLVTYDNIDWTISPSDKEKYEKEIVPALEFLTANLANMHAHGIFHGDAQVKNFAKTPAGRFALIDLEDSIIATDEQAIVSLINGGDRPEDSKVYTDISHMWYALTHQIKPEYINILFVDESREVCIAEFQKRVLEPYFKALEEKTPPHLFRQFKIETIKQALIDFVERTS